MAPNNDTLDLFIQDLLDDPSRARPLSFADIDTDDEPRGPAFFHGLIAALTLFGMVVIPTVVLVVALTHLRFFGGWGL